MFTSVSLNPKDVATFAAGSEFNTPELKAYAVDLVSDLQAQLTDICSTGKIDNLSDDTSVEFRFRTDGVVWDGSIWVTVHDDLPGCPCSVNCSISYFSDAPADCTTDVLGTFPEERYESFDLDTITAYSRSDVQQIRLEATEARVDGYVKGYTAGQEFERTTNA